MKDGRGRAIFVANNVITTDVPPYSVVTGNPARVVVVLHMFHRDSSLKDLDDTIREAIGGLNRSQAGGLVAPFRVIYFMPCDFRQYASS